VLTGLADAGVRLVAGSDAHARADVGRWRYALDAVAAPA
jgi:putative hydrolase